MPFRAGLLSESNARSQARPAILDSVSFNQLSRTFVRALELVGAHHWGAWLTRLIAQFRPSRLGLACLTAVSVRTLVHHLGNRTQHVLVNTLNTARRQERSW